MSTRRLATALALAAATWLASSAATVASPAAADAPPAAADPSPAADDAPDLSPDARAYFVGSECRICASGPLDCAPLTHVRGLRNEQTQVQLVIEAGDQPVSAHVRGGGTTRLEEQLFVPVRVRSRGADARAALPWSAAARPPDDGVLGAVADPLVPREESRLIVPAGGRRAWWLTITSSEPGVREVAPVVAPAGGPVLVLETLRAWMPRPITSTFAYLERDEPRLADASAAGRGCNGPELGPQAPRELGTLLMRHGVLPVDRATDVDELALQLRGAASSAPPLPRDLVVLGAYGSLGEPTDDALRRVEAMAAEVPADVRDVVLYAIDESCESDLAPRWRARLGAATGAAQRVKVLVTCSEDPTTIDADVVMTTAERFRPALAAAARAQGKEVWVYNGRLPQAGPMALDAPPESMVWLGWIAARYDVRRWFLWNVNHWSDGNRGGHGPRDPYVDPETFHNADGDAVLLDGLLVYPPRRELCPTDAQDGAGGAPLVRSARLARLRRGLDDATLLGAASSFDPEAAAEALDVVVPRALGDVSDDEVTPLGDAPAIARARGMLHAIIDAGVADPDAPDPAGVARRQRAAQAGLVALRAHLAARSLVEGPRARRASSPADRSSLSIAAAVAAVAGCLAAVTIAAHRLARRRRTR